MFNVLNFFKRKEKAPETVFEPTIQGDSDTDITNLTHKIDRLLTNKLFEISSQTRRSATREDARSEEHTSELQSHRDLHSFPTRRSSDLIQTLRI